MLHDYALQAGLECEVMRSESENLAEIESLEPEGFIFSPGPAKPQDHPLMFSILDKFPDKPVFGICLGFQAIGMKFGARLLKAEEPVHGKTSEVLHDGSGVFEGIPSPAIVTRYHSLVLETLKSPELVVNGYSNSNLKPQTSNLKIPMSFYHSKLPLWGVQFHPEAILTIDGLKMMKNWALFVHNHRNN
jgi:anthranilate synthase/aminodeoxychorismate synthase-like glutamine amidotransferase